MSFETSQSLNGGLKKVQSVISRVIGFLSWVSSRPTSVHFTIILLLLLLLSLCRSLSHASSPWHFSSRTNTNSHHSSFQFQIAALSVLCVMFLVKLFFVWNCWLFACCGLHIFCNSSYYSGDPGCYRYGHTFHVSLSVPNSCISQVTARPSNCTKMSEYVAVLLHVSTLFSNDQLRHRRATAFFWVIPRRLNSEAGELSRRKHTTFRTRRNFEIKNVKMLTRMFVNCTAACPWHN